MEYTKDIILEIGCKKGVNKRKLLKWTNNIKKVIMNNKFIFITMTSLISLTAIDIALVNSFIKLLAKF